jgi:hypothetical protein
MNVNVRYDNAHYGDHEKYATTLAELLDTFWFLDESGALTRDVATDLETAGKSIIHNGHATTTVTLSAEPQTGDTLEDSTCTECLTEDVTVTYQRTESWGNPHAPVGKVEFWLCGTCASKELKWNRRWDDNIILTQADRPADDCVCDHCGREIAHHDHIAMGSWADREEVWCVDCWTITAATLNERG